MKANTATDHSKTYRLTDIRNVVHIMRLRAIMRTLSRVIDQTIATYADYGCSNGFITSKIASRFNIPLVEGLDASDNVLVGARLHPTIQFRRFNLNVVDSAIRRYDLVTCFETLEHVGNIEAAIENVCNSRAVGGHLLISVPIEIGWIGFIKYVLKRFLFGYDLPLLCSDRQYAAALLKYRRLSHFRVPADSYGTHFGFDYRDVDEILGARCDCKFVAWNSGTTRFYLVSE